MILFSGNEHDVIEQAREREQASLWWMVKMNKITSLRDLRKSMHATNALSRSDTAANQGGSSTNTY
jgi:hypothetical protein